MIKNLIFDNGGVIVKDNWLVFLDNIVSSYGQDADRINELIRPYEYDVVVGKISQEEFREKILEIVKNEEEVSKIFQTRPLNPEMVEYIESLKGKFKLYLMTNDLLSFENDNKVWQMEKLFGENIFHSSKMKLSKPNKEAFEYVVDRTGIIPNESVFIDDKKRNTAAAKELGFKVITFKSLEQLEDELKSIIENNEK